ncbi:uncharacterized protein LOC144086257 [Stigmatopora argus]
MSHTPNQDKPTRAVSAIIGSIPPPRWVHPASDPSVPKRLCFYKSGDYTFGGHRLVVSPRTFKTFDALLDALSKKVPLPFGVRTITTPRGVHVVKGLDDLHDGGSYLCSDRRRVKPLNLEEVNRRQVPWKTARALSAGRRRRRGLRLGSSVRGGDSGGRAAKVQERVAVRTPRRLVVVKNKDPAVRRTIVLQKRTAPTYDALLDYLSQILQFPVLKLYSIDGRRIGGLAALILCSGFLVAAGNEPFRLNNDNFHRASQTVQAPLMEAGQPSMLQLQQRNHKSLSRNFSLSSEQYMINQINNSRRGTANASSLQLNPACLDTRGTLTAAVQRDASVLPRDDDIEKSFRVNRDGSVTVEMKVRLTVKEQEMLHWTTTVSRSSLRTRSICASGLGSGKISPDSNIYLANGPSGTCKEEADQPRAIGEAIGVTTSKEAKAQIRRVSTPGPRRVKKAESVESLRMLTDSGAREGTVGHYSYLERTPQGETMEGYCRVRHSNSSQRVPKPGKTLPGGNNTSLLKSSGVAEVLKIENDGIQIRETVMRIYESRGSYDNYVANGGVDGSSLSSSPPGSQSSPSNDVDFSWQRPAADSIQGQKEEMLSLSSEPVPRTHRLANGPSLASTNAVEMGKNFTQLQTETQKTSRSRLMDQEQKRSTVGKRNNNNHHGNKNPGSTESAKSTPNPKPVEKTHKTTSSRHGKEPQTLVRISTRERNLNKLVATYNGHNVNSSFVRPSMKKNVSDLLRLKKPSRNKTGRKSTTLKDTKLTSSELAQQCISKLSFNRSPIEIHQYVENWLKGIIPDPVVYMVTTDAPQPPAKVLFQIGCDSETEENNEAKTDPEGFCQTRSDPPRSSSSCPSVPILFQENKPTDDPSPALEPTHQRNYVSSNISGVSKNESASSPVDILNLKERMKPLLQEICTSVRSLPITLDRSSSCLDFPSQVALVFGSSCTAFVSFLAAMVLGDCTVDKSAGSDADSEAMIFLRFLQNISAIQDLDEQRASLIALRSGASQRLIERWMDFQTFRATLETELLMLNFQDAQDLAGFHGCIANDLMKDLHMPGELRMEISSGFAQFLREDLQGHSSESANQEPVIQETELKQSCDRVSIPEEPNDKDRGSLRASEREDDSEQGIGKAEKSEEAMDEGTRRREVSEEDSEEESVEKVEEPGLVRSESKENEQKDRLRVEEPGDEAMDDGPEEVRRDSAEKGVVDEVEDSDEENIAEDVEVQSVEDTAGEDCERDDFQRERDEKHSIDKDMEEVMEALVEDNMERNVDLTEATIDEGRVSVIHGELSTEEESVRNVPSEAENEDDLRCSSEENSEGESVENVTDKKEGGKEEDEGREKEDIEKSQEEEIQVSSEDSPEEEHADEAAGDMEQGDPTEPTEEMNDASSEKESVEEPEKANKTSTEGETEGDGADDLNGRPSQEANSDVEAPETFRTGPEREPGEEHQSNQKHSSESPKENLSDERFEEDLAHQNQAGIHRQEHGDLSHPVEISQELLDFVNSALRSSSLKCTYDGQGNLRIESERVQTPETKKKLDHESPCADKRLRSPITSDLSDYRPESLESAGHQSRESMDLSSESSGEVSENPPGDLMSLDSNASQISKSSSAGESISSCDSPTKALREVLSSCRRQAPPPEEEQDSQMSDGVLIDQGRWLLKENHLIRNSPPISEGMYRDSDDSSSDGSSSGDSSEESLAIQDNPLAAISSSELEDLARPQPPRCSYFSMPHGSDSDPFPDDASAKSGNKDGHYAKGKGARVSPATAAADAWDDKNGSLSSFASVEFKIAGGKVHPEGRGSSGAPEVGVQSQDSSDVVRVRCGEYCQIL